METINRSVILVVDDTPENLQLMSNLLRDHYKVQVAGSGEKALKLMAGGVLPDLVLLDILMPGMDGYEVCRRMRADARMQHVPVIFVTAKSDSEDEEQGLNLGAVDYITKPISPAITLARIRTHLSLKRAVDLLQDRNQTLEDEVRLRTRELSSIQDVTIMAMSSLAETRDNETGNHIRRTQNYIKALALQLKHQPRFSAYLSAEQIELLYKSAPLHDIGKVGIPDSILLKPGRLEPAEFEIMKTHTTLGRDAILAAENLLDSPNSFLQCAREIALSHQEKWDGSGYPEGLKGDAIPISARLMAVADVYDALISRRVYKAPMSHEQAVQIISEGRGVHFDPDIVDAFLVIAEDFSMIAKRFSDEH
jgi:putative two-component system response regulator